MNLAKLQGIRSIYKNELYFYIYEKQVIGNWNEKHAIYQSNKTMKYLGTNVKVFNFSPVIFYPQPHSLSSKDTSIRTHNNALPVQTPDIYLEMCVSLEKLNWSLCIYAIFKNCN